MYGASLVVAAVHWCMQDRLGFLGNGRVCRVAAALQQLQVMDVPMGGVLCDGGT